MFLTIVFANCSDNLSFKSISFDSIANKFQFVDGLHWNAILTLSQWIEFGNVCSALGHIQSVSAGL